MKKYNVRAYGNYERGLKTQDIVIEAESQEEAYRKAWRIFCEYEEIRVSEMS